METIEETAKRIEPGKPMLDDEVSKLLTNIKLLDKIKCPETGQELSVKYIDLHFDTRTRTVYGVSFRCFGGPEGTILFSLVNENKDKNLYEWIMEHHTPRYR